MTVAAPSGSFVTFSPLRSHCELRSEVPPGAARHLEPWPPVQTYESTAMHAHVPRLTCIHARAPGPAPHGSFQSMHVPDRHVSMPHALVAGTKDGRVLAVSTSAQLHLREQAAIPSVVHALHACGTSAIKLSSAMHSQILLLRVPRVLSLSPAAQHEHAMYASCLLYTSPSPRD